MRLASFRRLGRTGYGLVLNAGDTFGASAGIVELSGRLGPEAGTLKTFLEHPELWNAARDLRTEPVDFELDEITFEPVIPDPDKVLCVGVNYHAHREETGRAESAYPTLFTRLANTQLGHEQPLVRPRASTELDFEGELAVIIGRRGRHISERRALEHVAGYACYQDATLRDWQRHTTQFTPGKNFVGTGGFGPWMVTADEIPDPSKLRVSTRVNGVQMQQSTTDLLIFSVAKLIAYISTFTELVPGDVIATGTPGGVGSKRTPPVWLKPGDVVEVEVDRVGVLRNPVVQEPD